MKDFEYRRAGSAAEAVALLAGSPRARYLGGGTNLVDLMREGVEAPDLVVDVTRAGLDGVVQRADGGLRIGAGTRNHHLAEHPLLRTAYPLVTQALLAGATGQIRAMATVGGNLLQRTRCLWFYDEAGPCNKRRPGSGCGALTGFSRGTAILGGSAACISVHPSDLAVALIALDADVLVLGADGERTVALADLYLLPGDSPERETALRPGELVVAVDLPPAGPEAARAAYRKVRDRASYAFALVSVAAALDLDDEGSVRAVRLGLGGVAPVPWRAREAEGRLLGGPSTDEAFDAAIRAELAPARGTPESAFKVELTRRTVVATLRGLRDGGERG